MHRCGHIAIGWLRLVGVRNARRTGTDHEAFCQIKVTSKISKIDLDKHEVTLLPPEGKVQVVKVEDPDLQTRMKNLQIGQTVDAIYTEVLRIETSR